MSSQDFYNWCKLELLTTRASDFLRSHFKLLWQSRFNKPWDNSSGQDLVNLIKPKSFKSYFKSQQRLLQNGDIDHWDLQLLRNVYIDSDICGTGKQGDDCRKNVEKLADTRNKLAHHPSKHISETDYEKYWENISKILINMGELKDELDELKVYLRSNKIILLRSQNITKINQIKLKGNEYFKEKKYTDAISSYTAAIDFKDIPDQDRATLFSNRSVSYLKRYSEHGKNSDDIENAVKDAKKSRDLDPEWFKPYLRLGRAYSENNKLDKAVKAFDKALYFEPNNEELKIAQAEARRARGVQNRYEHLDPGFFPITEDQRCQDFEMRTGQRISPQNFEEVRRLRERYDPALKDVWEGHDYRDGTNGKTKDLAKAVQSYRRAVEKGNPGAMFNLAILTGQGQGVKQDYKMALSLFMQAAEASPFDRWGNGPRVGVGEAQNALGGHYLEGIYVEKSEIIAISWFERGVENGSGRSANNLGSMYLQGQGVTPNWKRAEQYFLFAVNHNDPNAPGNLIALYTNLYELEKATRWNNIAIEKGLPFAIGTQKELEALDSKLQEDLKKHGVEEWEKVNNLFPDQLTLKERILRKVKSETGGDATSFPENLARYITEIMTPPKAQEIFFKYIQF